MAEPDPPQVQHSSYLRKKRKKSRYLKQGCHKSERDDSRRVAARAFLSGITRDSHLREQSRGQAPAPEEGEKAYSYIAVVPSRKPSVVPVGAVEIITPSPPSTPILDAHYSPTSKRTHGMTGAGLESPQQTPMKQMTLVGSKSLDQVVESHSHHRLSRSGMKASNSVNYAELPEHKPPSVLHMATKWLSGAEGVLYKNTLPSPNYYKTGRHSRVVLTTHTGTVISVSSVLPYNKSMKLRPENPRERMRVRTNSFSLQMDLDGIQLGTTTEEVSLAFLLKPVWISSELSQTIPDPDTPSLHRRQSMRKSVDVAVDKRSSTPTLLTRYHLNPDVLAGESRRESFPGQVFRENPTPQNVILNYHPQYLNNDEWFASRDTATLTPLGYRLSIIKYANKSDIKKDLNDRFKEMYPHIEVSLTQLRKMKRKMYEISMECKLDLAAVAYAYVYFEKLTLMGKIHKNIRKPVAGMCLLLAAKFILDLKKQEISNLINEITDYFHVSSRELLLYEFPVLANLQFSLLTPTFQAKHHHNRLVGGRTNTHS